MVLASNEWLNNCEDDQKSAAAAAAAAANNTTTNNTTAAGTANTATTTTTTTTAANTETGSTEATATGNTISTTTITEGSTTTLANAAVPFVTTTTTTTTIAAATIDTNATIIDNIQHLSTIIDNRNLEESEDLQKGQEQQEQQQSNNEQSDKERQHLLMLNTITLKIMAENTNESIKNEATAAIAPTTTTTATDAVAETHDTIENNNREIRTALNTTFLNDPTAELNNSNSNSNTNSNTNTLQSSLTRQAVPAAAAAVAVPSAAKGTQQQQIVSPPITAQALSSALQSVMNATNNSNANAVAAGNLQNNFLSSLGMDIGANATTMLQQTAKQLSSSFLALDTTAALPSQTNLNNIIAQNADISPEDNSNNGQAKIVLLCETNSHPFQTRTILLTPNIECKVGRLIAKSKASESNAIFDCKVLSRNHAVLWYSDDGKFWVKDTKSSNGTFINENKLGNEAAELHFGDIVKFGVDVLENSRKEVHGCIIAFVKLYLPDGREAISIESVTQRSQYSCEGRISFDEIHRLNLYMQEVSQREKVLKSKLFNIQNVLDATRKNSALCWQSLIAEDQLLHRIHSLEKKLQIMEKNVPESVLRNEVLKLLDDKNSYQVTAKEALRKVYQERCDAMQMLAKVEAAYASSDSECKILRDQIMNTKQTLQEVNTRLERLESDYNVYKDEAERKLQEAKQQEERIAAELRETLNKRDFECADLKRRISEMLLKCAEQLEDEEQDAIKKLDAAISDMGMDVGYEEDDEEDDDNDNGGGDDGDGNDAATNNERKAIKERRIKMHAQQLLNDSSNSSGSSEKEKKKLSPKSSDDDSQKDSKQAGPKESTIMKWLQNSDLNEKEGSLDIFKAICNESDSSDEQDTVGAGNAARIKTAKDFKKKCTKFNVKLQSVQENLKLLETEIANEANKGERTIATLDDGSMVIDDSDEECEDDECDAEGEEIPLIVKRNGTTKTSTTTTTTCNALPKDNKTYVLLKQSVEMLRDAYADICENVKEQQKLQVKINNRNKKQLKETSSAPAISVQTQLQNYAQQKLNNIDGSGIGSEDKKLDTQDTLKSLIDARLETFSDIEEDDDDDDDDDNVDECNDDDDDLSDATSARLSISSGQTVKCKAATSTSTSTSTSASKQAIKQQQRQHDNEICDYQQQITQLNARLEQIENDSQNTLEIMQIECDTFKDRCGELTKIIDTLRSEKKTQQEIASVNGNGNSKENVNAQISMLEPVKQQQPIESTASDEDSSNTDDASVATDPSNSTFEQQMREDLAAINSSAVQREEELIMYKERLEQTQSDNLQLRSEIELLKLKGGDYTLAMLKHMLPYGAAIVAIIVYLITTYF